jgi:hypothetical protein
MIFVATKKEGQQIFSPSSFVAVVRSGIWDGQKAGSGSGDKHPGSATLLQTLLQEINIFISHFLTEVKPESRFYGWLQEAMLSRDLLVNIVLSAGIIVCGTLYVFKEMMEDGRMTARDTTMTFTCFVFFDMFNALSCRYDFF